MPPYSCESTKVLEMLQAYEQGVRTIIQLAFAEQQTSTPELLNLLFTIGTQVQVPCPQRPTFSRNGEESGVIHHLPTGEGSI